MKDLYFKILRHKAAIPASVGVASFAAGAAAGYFVGRKLLLKKLVTLDLVDVDFPEEVEEDPQMQIPFDPTPADTHQYFKSLADLGKAGLTPDDLKVEVNEQVVVDSDVNDPDVVSIFREDASEWNLEEELKNRDPEWPYVIHSEEFMEDEQGFSQTMLTYYAGDDILTDENDVPIYNRHQIVGDLPFGHGSNDQNVVYIRNERLRAEYEVLLDHGHYQVEVLGMSLQDELEEKSLRHSHHKFRMDD